METIFSETLTRLREGAGFSTAYGFFHDNGGEVFFKFTYRRYLLMEQGRNLPLVDRLPKLLVALRLPQNTPQAKELVAAWLRTLAGEEIYSDLLEPLLSGKPEGPALPPAEAALKRSLAVRKYHLTPEQVAATLESFETYKCAMLLEQEAGELTAAGVAKTLALPRPAAEKALKALAKAGLLKRAGKEGYRSEIAGAMVEYPPTAALKADFRDRLRDYFKRLEGDARVEYSSMGLLRADGKALRAFFPLMHANVEASNAYATTKKTRDSAAFFVIGKVLRLWEF